MKRKLILFSSGLLLTSLFSWQTAVNGLTFAPSQSEQRKQGPQEMAEDAEQKNEEMKTQTAPEKAASQDNLSVVSPGFRRLTDETVAAISNDTIRAFVRYYNETATEADAPNPMIDKMDPDQRVIVIAETAYGPALGYSEDGSEGVVGALVDPDGSETQIFDTSDHTKSATVGQIREALRFWLR